METKLALAMAACASNHKCCMTFDSMGKCTYLSCSCSQKHQMIVVNIALVVAAVEDKNKLAVDSSKVGRKGPYNVLMAPETWMDDGLISQEQHYS